MEGYRGSSRNVTAEAELVKDPHQPLVESPAINRKPGKRAITGHLPYNYSAGDYNAL